MVLLSVLLEVSGRHEGLATANHCTLVARVVMLRQVAVELVLAEKAQCTTLSRTGVRVHASVLKYMPPQLCLLTKRVTTGVTYMRQRVLMRLHVALEVPRVLKGGAAVGARAHMWTIAIMPVEVALQVVLALKALSTALMCACKRCLWVRSGGESRQGLACWWVAGSYLASMRSNVAL